MTSEIDLQRRIQLDCTDEYTRLWRNSVGQAWLGRTFSVCDGQLVSGSARRVSFGLAPGSADLVGPRSIVVTSEMVGQRVAIFAAIEIKSVRGTVSDEQQAFIDTVNKLGGRAGVARSVDEARAILK